MFLKKQFPNLSKKIDEILLRIKVYMPKRRFVDLRELFLDFTKKCNEDHITAFGAMSAFFFLMSLLPFMIILLTITRFLPFTKDDIQNILLEFISFERSDLIRSLINEVYHKTGASVFTISIIATLWSSSKGIFSVVKGLNSVYDIENDRNYFVLRFFSVFYTVILFLLIIAMLILWVFGNTLYNFVSVQWPFLKKLVEISIHRGNILTFFVLVVIFLWIYQFIPTRRSRFLHQLPGSIIAALGWITVSKLCALYVDHFSNFTYVYGSMTGITILLIWMYFCMSMVFYGAEINYFLENKDNYHTLIRILRPNLREARRQKEKELKEELELKRREELERQEKASKA